MNIWQCLFNYGHQRGMVTILECAMCILVSDRKMCLGEFGIPMVFTSTITTRRATLRPHWTKYIVSAMAVALQGIIGDIVSTPRS